MAFKMKPSSFKQKKSYKEAYEDRDKETYGNMTQEEYTAEAKRQKSQHSKTGSWDVGGRDTELVGRWKGMTLGEFDDTLAEELDSYINSEPKPTAEEIKAFKARHGKFRDKARGK